MRREGEMNLGLHRATVRRALDIRAVEAMEQDILSFHQASLVFPQGFPQ
jgi:hypothetical protein